MSLRKFVLLCFVTLCAKQNTLAYCFKNLYKQLWLQQIFNKLLRYLFTHIEFVFLRLSYSLLFGTKVRMSMHDIEDI